MQKEETDRLRSQTTGLIGAMDCFSEGIMLVNTDSENWNILFVNDAWSRVTGEPGSTRGLACITHSGVVPRAPGTLTAAVTLP